MKSTILTHSGLLFNLLEPDPDLIEIEDIAHALSNLCRFTGHTRVFYSVAEHSLYCSMLTTPEFAFEALLHDAAEAYLGDVSTPLKQLLPDYRAIEQRMEAAIRQRFGLPAQQSPAVKHADLRMLAAEKRDLMPSHVELWPTLEGITPALFSVKHPTGPADSFDDFLYRFDELGGRA